MAIRAPDAALLERDPIVGSIDSLTTRAVDGAGSFMVLEGEAGIGKTSVLDVAQREAAARGMVVLSARGRELEQSHSLGIVAELLAPVVRADETGGWFRGAAAPARSLFDDPGREGSWVPTDLQTMLHALYWLTLNVAEQGPLFIAVDDAHWADETSLHFIAYLAERIEPMAAAMVVALRPGVASHSVIGEHVRSHRRAARITLQPLSRTGVDELITSTGEAVSPANRELIWTQAGGNPFYVVELARASARASDLGEAIANADAIRTSVRRRLADEDGVAARVAEAIAILGDAATGERVAELAGEPAAEAAAAIRRLTDRFVLSLDRLEFRHPILLSIVLETIPAAVRSQLHGRAAQILHASGAAPLVIAAHLLSSDPAKRPATVALLRDAARASLAAGDADGAVRFLHRGLAEPPEPTDVGPVLLELAEAESAAGEPAADRYEAAIEHLPPGEPRARARLAQGLGLIRASSWPEAARAFQLGLADAEPGGEIELVRRLESGYISSAYVGLSDHAEANRRLSGVLASSLDDPASRELAAWSAFQQTMQVTGGVQAADELSLRVIDAGVSEEMVRTSQVVELVAGALIGVGRLAEDARILTEALDVARRINAHAKVGVYSYCRSIPLYLMGRIREAIADGETAVGVHRAGWETFYPGVTALLAWAHLERGDLAAAEAAVAIDDEIWGQRLDFVFLHRIARARVAMARGDLQGSLDQLEQVRLAGDEMGIQSVQLLADWRNGAALVLRAMERRDEAVRVAEEAVELSEAWGEPIAKGRALRSLGLCRGGAEGVAHLRFAVSNLAGSPARLDAVRAATDLGAALRREGHSVEARETLAKAADDARRMGAVAIEERARSELTAAGARPRRLAWSGVEALTPSELRVARLAAAGRTNREVAQALFVTPKAIEFHLANAYRKLDIDGRGGLLAALGESTTEPIPSV